MSIQHLTITPNSYVSVNVTHLEGGGTGASAFPAGMNIFYQYFLMMLKYIHD